MECIRSMHSLPCINATNTLCSLKSCFHILINDSIFHVLCSSAMREYIEEQQKQQNESSKNYSENFLLVINNKTSHGKWMEDLSHSIFSLFFLCPSFSCFVVSWKNVNENVFFHALRIQVFSARPDRFIFQFSTFDVRWTVDVLSFR